MAKKSMVERERKRINLEKKYAPKREALLVSYANESNFTKKMELHSKIQKLPRIVQKHGFGTDVGKLAAHVVFSVILEFHVMFFEKWRTNVYYLE